MDLKNVIKKPIITEKATQEAALGRYSFEVDRRANKREIARAIEEFFKVRVQKVRTIMVRGKRKRVGRTRREVKRSDWKKAIVQLTEGQKIDIFDLPARPAGGPVGRQGTGE